MAYKTCPDCGSRVYKLGCVNCDEENYIAEQEYLTQLQYPDPPRKTLAEVWAEEEDERHDAEIGR